MRSTSAIIVLAIVSLASLPAQSVAADDDVLIMRFGWAPIFCFSGSSSPVPKEFCGLKAPALTRFIAHRALRILYSGEPWESCPDPTAKGFNYTALPSSLRKALHCVDNSYTIGNDDDYLKFLWDGYGTCVSQVTGMTSGTYFQLLADSFKRYDVDGALKKAGLNLYTPGAKVGGEEILDVLEKAFGYRGFYTCDQATKTRYSTVSICLSTKAPYLITKCPDKLLKPKNKCAAKLEMLTKRSKPVSKSCLKYYPSFA